MDPDTDPEFWTFSWHEIGIHDLPAMIDYVLLQTGFKKIGYFGHSQGTTTFWVLASMHPEYNEKITMMHALAPVAFMRHVKAPLLGYARSFVKMSEPRIREFMPRKEMLWRTCLASPITEGTCLETYYQIVGKDVETTNTVGYEFWKYNFFNSMENFPDHVPNNCRSFSGWLQSQTDQSLYAIN